MPEPERILAHVGRMLEARSALAGRRVLVTAGPTREAVDPVRFISNHSSGKMGVAIAAAAWRRGADVTLVAGPLSVAPPHDVRVVNVESTEQMNDAVRAELATADVLVMAAAPADFRPKHVVDSKIKKGDAPRRARTRKYGRHSEDHARRKKERRRYRRLRTRDGRRDRARERKTRGESARYDRRE